MSDVPSALPSPRPAADDEARHHVVVAVRAAAAGPAPVGDALRAALDGVCDTLGFPVGHAYLYDAVIDQLVSTPLWHVSNPYRFGALMRLTAATHVVPDVGLVGRVWYAGRPVCLGVIHDDPLFRRSRVALSAGLRAAIGVPVLVDGRVVAILEFFAPRHLRDDPHLVEFLDEVVAELSGAFAAQRVGVAD